MIGEQQRGNYKFNQLPTGSPKVQKIEKFSKRANAQ
jgi:hypothetical protein